MDQRAKAEVKATLERFGVETKDREPCLQEITEAFASYQRRSRANTGRRREIEAQLRSEASSPVPAAPEVPGLVFIYGSVWVPRKIAKTLAPAPHGWRRRRVGELWAAGDLRVICDWGEARLIEPREVGTRTLGPSDGFNDMILTPRKRALHKLIR